MSEIICFYSFTESNETGYFLIENTITFHQLKNFILNAKIIDDSFSIQTASNEPLTEENLPVLIAEAASSDSPIQIIFKSNASPSVPVPEPVVPQPAPEPVKVEPIGPTMRSILEKIGVKLDESVLSDVQKCLSSLPFPYSFFFKQYLDQVIANPNLVQTIAKQAADMFSVDEQTLLAEVKVAIDFIQNPPAPEQVKKEPEPEIPAPKVEEAAPQPDCAGVPNFPFPGCRGRGFGRCGYKWRRTGENGVKFHPANCDNCKTMISGIRFYCLHCKNYDLCAACEQKNTDAPFHDESHVFAKIRDPATPYRIDHIINAPNAAHPHPHHHLPPRGFCNPPNQENSSPAEVHPNPDSPNHPHPRGFPFPFHPHHPFFPRPSSCSDAQPKDETNPESQSHPHGYRAHPHPHRPFPHPRFHPRFFPAPPNPEQENAAEYPAPNTDFPNHPNPHWSRRFQHRAEAMNRLDQLETSVQQLKETIAKLQNEN